MTAVTRPRSPLAHGPAGECRSCRDCGTCDGGRRDIPRHYWVTTLGPTCSGCAGTGRACHNLVPDSPEVTV